AAPPQLAPPSVPGKSSVGFVLHGVNGPELDRPAIDATRSAHARACSGVVSAAVTRSAGVYATRASAGGFTGIGWGGKGWSPGTSLRGIGRSSTPKIGAPVSRFSRYRYPDFVVRPSAGIVRPPRTTSNRAGGAGGS